MKEWNNPELLSLGVESTFNTDNGNHEDDNSQNEGHWCHRLGTVCNTNHNGNTGDHSSVNASHHHTGEDWGSSNVVNYNKCCCKDYKPPQS